MRTIIMLSLIGFIYGCAANATMNKTAPATEEKSDFPYIYTK